MDGPLWLHLSKSVIWGHIWNLTQDRNRTDRTDRQDEQTRHIGWTNRVERISGRNFSQLYLYFKYFESGDFFWVQIAFSTLSQHGKISWAEPYRTNLSASCEVCFYTFFMEPFFRIQKLRNVKTRFALMIYFLSLHQYRPFAICIIFDIIFVMNASTEWRKSGLLQIQKTWALHQQHLWQVKVCHSCWCSC